MKARLSVPRREPTAGALADEGVSVFWLRYVIDVHHLDCPLLFGCQKKKKKVIVREKRERLTNFCHQTLFYKLISDMTSCLLQSLAKESTMTRTISKD
jgi:hypothetical protein